MVRPSKLTRSFAYKLLVTRDGGERCLRCGAGPEPEELLDIDHADADPHNWTPDNLSLACHKCNCYYRKLKPSRHIQLIREYRDRLPIISCVCDTQGKVMVEPASTVKATDLLKMKVDYSSGTTEMRVTGECEGIFREGAISDVEQYGEVERKKLVNDNAELAGCSPMTAGRYLDKLVSRHGPLYEVQDVKGKWVVKLKAEVKREYTLPEFRAMMGDAAEVVVRAKIKTRGNSADQPEAVHE